jgi:hypothetical protein
MHLYDIDLSQDSDTVVRLASEHPAFGPVFTHIFKTLKHMCVAARDALMETGDVSDTDANISTRYILRSLFESYMLNMEIHEHYKDYSPVEYEQMVEKLVKLTPETICEFLGIAKEDKEKALDYLDAAMENLKHPENNNGEKH